MIRSTIFLLLLACPSFAGVPCEVQGQQMRDEEKAAKPDVGGPLDEGHIRGIFERLSEDRDKRKGDDVSKAASEAEFDSEGNLVTDKKGFVMAGLIAIIGAIAVKVIKAMLWAYLIHQIMGYWWVPALFFVLVFLVSFIGGRIGGRTVRA